MVSVSLALQACSTVGVTRIKPSQAREAGCDLEVFTAESEVKRPFEVVCLLDARTGTTAFHQKTGAAAIETAKPKACECGADALLIANVETQGMTLATWGQGRATLKAIRFTDK